MEQVQLSSKAAPASVPSRCSRSPVDGAADCQRGPDRLPGRAIRKGPASARHVDDHLIDFHAQGQDSTGGVPTLGRFSGGALGPGLEGDAAWVMQRSWRFSLGGQAEEINLIPSRDSGP